MSKNAIKDLDIWTGEHVSFEEHIKYIVKSSNIRIGMLLRVFKTREPEHT